MPFRKLLGEKRRRIIEVWERLVFETYPTESGSVISGERDVFANPVGAAIRKETGRLFDAVVAGEGAALVGAIVEDVVRIRAVQDFRASEAVAYIFLLKKAVREAIGEALKRGGLLPDLLAFESRVDDAALAAFDIYVSCREKIGEIRVREAKAEKERVLRVLRAVNRTLDGGRSTMNKEIEQG